jgi:hypothetical protein
LSEETRNLGHLAIGVGEVKHPRELSSETDTEEGYSGTSKRNPQEPKE